MRVPTLDDVRAAWMALPLTTRDEISLIAVDLVFQGFLYGDMIADEDQVLPCQDARDVAGDRETARLGELHRSIAAALPDLFGPANENPAWADTSPIPNSDAVPQQSASAPIVGPRKDR